jgi:hypothetical protein
VLDADAALDEQVLLHQPRLPHVGRVQRHELVQGGLVVAVQRHRRDEADGARAQPEVIEAAGAVTGLQGAAALQHHRHHVLGEERLAR